jgi:hypothetical protein
MDDRIHLSSCPERIRAAVRDFSLTTWEQFAKITPETLLKRHNFGRKSLNFVYEELRLRGHPVPVPPEAYLGRILSQAGVYFVQGADLVKIGASTYIPYRVKSLQAMSPVPLELLTWINVPFARDLAFREREHHIRFSALHAYSEWFRHETPLREYVEELRKSQP